MLGGGLQFGGLKERAGYWDPVVKPCINTIPIVVTVLYYFHRCYFKHGVYGSVFSSSDDCDNSSVGPK